MRVFCFRHIDHGVSHPEARDALFERSLWTAPSLVLPLGPAVKVHMLLTKEAVTSAAANYLTGTPQGVYDRRRNRWSGWIRDLIKGATNNAKLSLGEFINRRTPDARL